jgi:molybdate transport system substrate-binding protein
VAECPVRLVNGSSAVLAQQIGNAAQFDLFLSANAAFVDQLASNGKILPGSVKPYAVGRLGVLWRDGKKHPLRELTTSAAKYIALPNPKLAPYGVAAQEALEYAGLWGMVQSKVVYGENVRQALQLVESGNADAVITSDSLLQGKDADLIPADWHKPIIQKAGIVAASQNRERARRFLEFLLSPAGQAILARYGFGKP